MSFPGRDRFVIALPEVATPGEEDVASQGSAAGADRKLGQGERNLLVEDMSGYSGDQLLAPEQIADRGAFLEKPFTPQELSGAARRLLDEARG